MPTGIKTPGITMATGINKCVPGNRPYIAAIAKTGKASSSSALSALPYGKREGFSCPWAYKSCN